MGISYELDIWRLKGVRIRKLNETDKGDSAAKSAADLGHMKSTVMVVTRAQQKQNDQESK